MKHLIYYLLLFAVILSSCDKMTVSDLEPYSELISVNGKTIRFDDPNHPLHGLVIEIPDSAVIYPMPLELTKTTFDEQYSNEFLLNDSKMYRIYQNDKCFYLPIKITLPYDEDNYTSDQISKLAVYYFNEDKQIFFPLIVNNDTNNHLIEFITYHTGTFGVCYPHQISKNTLITTSFLPEVNGFRIDNFVSATGQGLCDQYATITKHGGHCAGISNFSLYYFLNMKSFGGLFNRYDEYEQKIKACRIQEWTFSMFDYNIPPLSVRNLLIENFEKDKPVLLICKWGQGIHAILACGIEETNLLSKIYYYDPNEPGIMQSKSIEEIENILLNVTEQPLFPNLEKNASLCGQWEFTFSNARATNITLSGEIPEFSQSFKLYTTEYMSNQNSIKIPAVEGYNEEITGTASGFTFSLDTKTEWMVIDQIQNQTTTGEGETELNINFIGSQYDSNCAGTLTFHIPRDFYGIFDWLVPDAYITFDITGTRPWNKKKKIHESSLIKSNSLNGSIKSLTFEFKK